MAQNKSFLIDMDGVLVLGHALIPGAGDFIERLTAEGHKFMLLTNNSRYPPTILQHRLHRIGLDIPAERIHTSAIATAQFLNNQRPGGTAYVLGEDGLYEALEDIEYTITDEDPDYVVLGETNGYSFDRITRAIQLIVAGARFIATNPDISGLTEAGLVPAAGALAALVERATGVSPYFVGKPNPLMIRTALRRMNEHSESTIMVGDRMDTDILIGTEGGLETVLVLTGVTSREQAARYPYQPSRIVESVADLP